MLFLASDRSAKTTGCTLTVDGGVKDAFPAMSLRFGIGSLSLTSRPAEQFELVRRVEALGFDSVWTGDHVSFHGPISRVAHAARHLRARSPARIRLGTAVYLLALRRPAIAAKTTATLDALSGGRLDLRRRRGRREPQGVRGLRRARTASAARA